MFSPITSFLYVSPPALSITSWTTLYLLSSLIISCSHPSPPVPTHHILSLPATSFLTCRLPSLFITSSFTHPSTPPTHPYLLFSPITFVLILTGLLVFLGESKLPLSSARLGQGYLSLPLPSGLPQQPPHSLYPSGPPSAPSWSRCLPPRPSQGLLPCWHALPALVLADASSPRRAQGAFSVRSRDSFPEKGTLTICQKSS